MVVTHEELLDEQYTGSDGAAIAVASGETFVTLQLREEYCEFSPSEESKSKLTRRRSLE